MDLEFDKQYLPVVCDQCDKKGFIFVDHFDIPCLVMCDHCGGETSNVWCPKCRMGGAFVRNISQHPSYWICTNCQTKYQLANAFYENPIKLYFDEELPVDVRQRIKDQTSSTELQSHTQKFLAYVFLLLLIATLLIPWWAMYELLKLLPASIGLIGIALFFLLCFAWLRLWLYFSNKAMPKIIEWQSKIKTK